MKTAVANQLTLAERGFLLQLARDAIRAHFHSGRLPVVHDAELSPGLREPHACFVTLTRAGDLRGCIGNLQSSEPLYRAVIQNACGAAFRDSRFVPVAGDEVDRLVIEISVLTPLVRLVFDSPEDLLRKLRPGTDGVVLKMDGRTATFLPQVWLKVPDAASFMNELANKARLPSAAWRQPEAEVSTYQVESFADASGAAD